MAARDAQRPRSGGACSLHRLWSKTDLADQVVAYLPLHAIAGKLPVLDRRFRDEHLPMLGRLARRHKTLRASTTAFLDEIRATGRDLRMARFDASDLSVWDQNDNPPDRHQNDPRNNEYEMASVGGVSCIRITKTTGRGHRGLELPFNLGQHCIRQIRYKFRFHDSLPDETSGDYGFAYLHLAPFDAEYIAGLYVSKRHDGNYILHFQWFHMVENYYAEDGDGVMAPVGQNTWYSVTMVFDWTTYMVRVGLATPGRHICEKDFPFEPSAIHKVTIYNFSASVSCYAGLEVLYPAE